MSNDTEKKAKEPFSFLKLTHAERIYCVEFATGKSHQEICAELPYTPSPSEQARINRAKLLDEDLPLLPTGVDPETVADWRIRHVVFDEALRSTLNDPSWPIRNIVMPMLIAMSAKLELDYLYQRNDARPFKGISPKTLELWMTMGGMFEKEARPAGAIAQITGSMQLVLPELRPSAMLAQGAKPERVTVLPGATLDDTEGEGVEREA